MTQMPLFLVFFFGVLALVYIFKSRISDSVTKPDIFVYTIFSAATLSMMHKFEVIQFIWNDDTQQWLILNLVISFVVVSLKFINLYYHELIIIKARFP